MNLDKRVNGNTRIIGIIGNPIKHTKSPFLHNTLSNVLQDNYIYVPFLVNNDSLKEAIYGMKALNISGINVTVPYKSAVIDYLDEVAEDARLMESVNTIKLKNDKLIGYNTDGEGFIKAFRARFATGFKAKKVAILGAGGSTKSIAVKIALNGAEKIYIVNRTIAKAKEIELKINNHLNKEIVQALSNNDDKLNDRLLESDIIINTTSLGMFPNINLKPINEGFMFQKGQLVYDIIYTPNKTKFLQIAEKCGCEIENGMKMLFCQAIESYKIWSERNEINNDIINKLWAEFGLSESN